MVSNWMLSSNEILCRLLVDAGKFQELLSTQPVIMHRQGVAPFDRWPCVIDLWRSCDSGATGETAFDLTRVHIYQRLCTRHDMLFLTRLRVGRSTTFFVIIDGVATSTILQTAGASVTPLNLSSYLILRVIHLSVFCGTPQKPSS